MGDFWFWAPLIVIGALILALVVLANIYADKAEKIRKREKVRVRGISTASGHRAEADRWSKLAVEETYPPSVRYYEAKANAHLRLAEQLEREQS